MSKQTETNLFIHSSLPRLYQRLLNGAVTCSQLGNHIISEIKTAHAFRQIDAVRELAGILINFPIKEFQLVAEYYFVWCDYREGKYNSESLDRIIDQTETCKTQALTSRATFEAHKGNTGIALYFYSEALKTSRTVSEYIDLSRAIAAMKGQEGFHKTAIRDMENLLPLVGHAEPLSCYELLNSYAVELGEAGRKDEARNVIRHALASPYAMAYPEWRETAQDLKPARKSLVAIKASSVNAANLLSMPADRHAEPIKQASPARVINLQQWKAKMAKDESKGETPNDRRPNEELDERELMLRIYQLVSTRGRTGAELFDILTAIEKVLAEHKAKQ